MDWKNRFQNEIKLAEAARKIGNEGRARVCSRRAAGIVVQEFFQRQGIILPSVSAYDSFIYLVSLPDLPPRAREIINHLLMKVEPDHSLPIQADLIEETLLLKRELLGDEI
jgi:hypothetical protein